ncbi:hypothetical protein ACOTV2_12190, partial [Aliarcobacter butzleri]
FVISATQPQPNSISSIIEEVSSTFSLTRGLCSSMVASSFLKSNSTYEPKISCAKAFISPNYLNKSFLSSSCA